jgi:hypothetical protein
MPDPAEPDSSGEPHIRPVYKIVLYVAAWIVALVVTDPTFKSLSLIHLFPLGLIAFFNLRLGNDGGWGLLGAAVAVYVVHAVFYFRSRKAAATIFWFALLVGLLLCNVAGCREQLPPH